MTRQNPPFLLKVACAFTLTSLAMISFAILHPAPLAVIAAMSIGQGIGTLGFVLFMVVVVRDVRPRLRDHRKPAAVKAEPAVVSEAERSGSEKELSDGGAIKAEAKDEDDARDGK